MRSSPHSFGINQALAAGALLLWAITSLSAQTRPWWDDYPLIVGSADLATVQSNNGTCGFGNGDPSWGMYVQKAIGDWGTPVQMHNAGCKYITYYETFGTATCFILELGAPTAEGDSAVYRFYWSWNMIDTNGGAFRWAGPQNYFDAEDFCGPYTRLHPVYGAGGRAMTYPDGTPANGYFDNDRSDPRKSRALDAACSKDILGTVENWLSYRDETAGNPLRSGGLIPVTVDGQSHLVGHVSFAKDAACPMWIDQHRSSVLYSVARGQIDGIWTDNFSPWDNFGYPPVKVAFGDWSVARFRDYLSANFTAAQLTAMGVSNVTTFDVRTALRGKLTALGGTDTNLDDAKWNDAGWLNDSLWRAYKIYKRQVGTEALTNFYNASKEAAAQMGVSDFAVMGNDIPVFSLGYCRGTLDVVSTELTPGWHMGTSARGFMMPPVGRFAPAYKLGREHAKSRLVNVWMYLDGAYKENPGAVSTIYYEMLANHTLPMLHPGNPGTTQSATINGGFTDFVKNSRTTFGGRDSLSDVGIYYSTSSVLAYMTPAGFYDMDNQPHTAAYNGWGTALGNLHYQYRPIPEWKLTADALAKLRVLIIPNAEVLDSADVTNIIDPWVRAGGLLIVTGNSGARKGEPGNFDSYTSFSLSGLTGVTGLSGAPSTKLTTVGSGKVYYIKNNIGLSYFNASTAIDRASLIAGFSTAMSQVLGTEKALLYPVTTIPETVGLNLYEDPAARRLFIDVNNYDVNLATDAVTATPAVTFTVAAPAWLAAASIGNIRVKVLSPTTPVPTVTVTKSGTDRIQVELGAVTHYASVVVSEETSLTWNGGGGSPSDNSGTWDATSGNWWSMTAAVWSDLNDAVFGVGSGSNTPYIVSLGSGFTPTVGNLIFANHSYTLTNGTINLGAASEIQVAGSATIGSTLAGESAGLTKTGDGILVLTGANTYGGATLISAGTLKVHATNAISLVNAGFELPAYGAGGWAYMSGGSDGVAGGWTSTNGARAGIAHNGSPWVATAPEGGQAGFVQYSGTQGDLNQIITVAAAGSYTLGFSAASRPSYFSSSLAVKIDDVNIAEWPASSFTLGTFSSFSVPLSLTAGAHKLTFKNTSIAGDNATAIDQVTISGAGALALPATTAVNLTAPGTTLDLGGVPFVIGSLSGVAGSSVLLDSPLTAGTDDASIGFAGVISGAGSFTKAGEGTMTLSGSNTYTGATTISAGTLQLGDGASGHDGSINSSASILNNATLAFNLSGDAVSYPAISGTGNLTKTGNGTLTLAANDTYTGTTTINGGTLALMGASGWALNGSRAGNEVIVNSGATLKTNYSHQFGFTGTLANITVNSGGTFNGSLGNFIGQLALNGNASVFGTDYLGLTGGLITYTGFGSQAGSIAEDLLLRDVPNNAVSATVSVSGNNPSGDLTISSVISGPAGASLTKTGNGMLVLSGNNTYPGPTSINAGTLKLTGSLHASSAVTVNATATLMGTGTVNGPLAIASGGAVAPGASAGTMTAGNTTISGTYVCQINGATADLLNVTGDLTINPGATLAFGTLSTPTFQSYIIASCSGTLTGTFSNVTGTPVGYHVVYDSALKQIRLERTSFGSWISLRGLTGDSAAFNADPDHDGVANGLEFVLGGEPNPANPGSNSTSLLPTLSDSSGDWVLSFHRKDVSEANVSLTCQWSTNLIFLSPASDIPVGATSSFTNGVSVSITEDVPDTLTDTINITVPSTKAAAGKLFLRLKAVQVP